MRVDLPLDRMNVLDRPEVEVLAPDEGLQFGQEGTGLEDIEYHIIMAALEYSKYNLSRAARLLGISRDAIRYRKEKYEQKSAG